MTPPEERIVRIEVNGRPTSALVEPRTLLCDYIRNHVGLTGTNVGCEHGVCGACTVRIDGDIARSCITFAAQVDGGKVETVESIAPSTDELHPIQRAFEAEHGLQCGFCTPGFLITTQALLERNPDPSETEIREFLSGNICRCTGYVGIVNAVKRAARDLRDRGT
ncbi:MAG: (2Fe-2S)-binding protein [Actinobacteria bacterium]|nr:(2Fe-2S)-binding protein [Actinomycetota bacterium]